jgi:putative transcriptional regulator
LPAGLRGKLLVATPDLEEATFFRTVVLVLEHNLEGAIGVVLNRPTAADVHEVLPGWADLAADPPVVFSGGPVQPEAAIGIGRRVDERDGDGFAPLFGDLGTVDLERDPDDVVPRIDTVRVYAGYAGWGPGQLDGEVAASGWFVVESELADPWTRTPGDLWRGVLRRQGGTTRLFADFPVDPTLN